MSEGSATPKFGVIKQQRGPHVRIITLLEFNVISGEFESREYKVNNMAAVRFKRSSHYGSLECSVSAKKLDTAKDFSVELKISSTHLNCSELLLLHTDNWTEWMYLGNTSDYLNDNQSKYLIQVDIITRKVNNLNVHTKVYDDEEFIDFHLCAADGSVGVHKVFLAAYSDVFKSMLQGKWKETAEGRIELEGLTRLTLQHLKDYLYLGTLPNDGLCPLLLLARYFLIDDLKTRCVGKLVESVTSDNLYALLDFACENNIPELTYDILHLTLDETVDSAYKNKFN